MRNSLFAIALTALISTAVPALACSQPDLGPEVYCGTYRGGPKTSFYKTAEGRLGTFFHFNTVSDLLDYLPPDEEMRQLGAWRPDGPQSRIAEERQNVQVPAYIAAVKPGEPQPITAARRSPCGSARSAAIAPVPHAIDMPAPPWP